MSERTVPQIAGSFRGVDRPLPKTPIRPQGVNDMELQPLVLPIFAGVMEVADVDTDIPPRCQN